MTSFLFVHGTGVRESGLAETLRILERRISKLPGRNSLDSCAWGKVMGSPEIEELKTVPDFQKRKGEEADTIDNEAALWALLYRDALFELRLLNVQLTQSETQPFGANDGQQLRNTIVGWRLAGESANLVDRAAIASDVFQAAHATISKSQAFTELLESACAPLTRYREAAARAICAQAVLYSFERDQIPAFISDRHLRDSLIDQLVIDFGGREAVIPSWVTKPFLQLGKSLQRRAIDVGVSLAEKHAQSHAGMYLQSFYRNIGDVLLYQSKGGVIRDAIRDSIKNAGESVVLLTHSLGGIASFETLVEECQSNHSSVLNRVRLFVTMGSQVSFLYEINALQSLNYDPHTGSVDELPTTFPRWLNIYDPNDLLSYLSEPMFGAQVEDKRIESGQPFPMSHSSYWQCDETWAAIGDKLS